MQKIINPVTGEVIDDEDIDSLIAFVKDTEMILILVSEERIKAKNKLLELAKFENGTNTARIQGKTLKCKIELPSRINWDQKKLANIYSVYPHGTIVDSVIKIATYKVDMREYKKIINTISDDKNFNNFKKELMESDLGTCGSPKVTIEN